MKKVFKFLLLILPLVLILCACNNGKTENTVLSNNESTTNVTPSETSTTIETIESSTSTTVIEPTSSSTSTTVIEPIESSTSTTVIEPTSSSTVEISTTIPEVKYKVKIYANETPLEFSLGDSKEITSEYINLVVDANNISKPHFDRDGWYLDSDFSKTAVFPITLNEDNTTEGVFSLYLKWAEHSKGRIVVYYDGISKFVQSKLYLNDLYTEQELFDAVLTSDMKKEGFLPFAWYKDVNLTEPVEYPYSITKTTGNNIYLQWKSAAVNAKLNVNSDTDRKVEHVYTLNYNLTEEDLNSICNLDKQYYSFEGWYFDKQYTNPVTYPYTLTDDFELFAKWHYDYRQVSIYPFANELKYKSEMYELHRTITENDLNELVGLNTLTRDGFINTNEWYFDDTFKEQAIFPITISEDSTNISLYLKWNSTRNANDCNLSVTVFDGKSIGDFSKYEGTSAYVQVSTPDELLDAISKAKYSYTNTVIQQYPTGTYKVRNNVRKSATNWVSAITKGLYLKDEYGNYNKIPADTPWDENDPIYTNTLVYYEDDVMGVDYKQTLGEAGTVHVIEIMNDMNLGWNKISAEAKSKYPSVISNYNDSKAVAKESTFTMSSMFLENGISNIQLANCYDLLIYSKNGAKLTHVGFSLLSDNNIVFRNLSMDEIWQWEDTASATVAKVGDMDAFGWAYFKISYCGYIWIDHCTFGKSYDGQIDVSNAHWATTGDLFRAPFSNDPDHPDMESRVCISWCNFAAGSSTGYIATMMQDVEADYQANGNHYLYYKALRDAGISAEEILNGIAIPQKKGCLLGDNGNADEYKRNIHLAIEYKCCMFKNIEDRLPKLRGGNAVFSNCIIDCSEYYPYHAALKEKNAASIVSAINSSWKCALVSQAIVCGNGGSVLFNNCEVKGVVDLLKNNDTPPEGCDVNGGYKFINSVYYIPGTDKTIEGSTPETAFVPEESNLLTTANFKWNNDNHICPFDIYDTDLSEIGNSTYGYGVKASFTNSWLKTIYFE